MPLFSIDLSGEFQSFLIVEALSAAIGIGVMKLHSGRTFVSVLGYRVSRFSDGVFIANLHASPTNANETDGNLIVPNPSMFMVQLIALTFVIDFLL